MSDSNIKNNSQINNNDNDEIVQASKITHNQKKLRLSWLLWLGFRGIAIPLLLSILLATHPNMLGGIVWQLMWLIPAFIITPWILQAKSPYALLLLSMVTLIYFGSSGVTLFSRFYDSGLSVLWVYIIDLIFLLLINFSLFKLLKSLPSMNKKAK